MDDKFWSKLTKMLNDQYGRFDERVNKLEESVDTRIDNVFTKMDSVYKEVVDMRQEQAMHSGSHQRVDEQLEDHEKRIKKIETKRMLA